MTLITDEEIAELEKYIGVQGFIAHSVAPPVAVEILHGLIARLRAAEDALKETQIPALYAGTSSPVSDAEQLDHIEGIVNKYFQSTKASK